MRHQERGAPRGAWVEPLGTPRMRSQRFVSQDARHRRAGSAQAAPRPDRAGHARRAAGPVAAGLRPGLHPDAGHPHRQRALHRLHGARASWRRACCSSPSSTASPIIWERDLGIVHKFLVSPTPRAALVLGKALSAGVRALSQAVIIYILALILGVQDQLEPAGAAGRAAGRHAGRGLLLDLLADHRLPGQDPRALHGHRPGADHAAVLRQQRHLPASP